MSFASRSGCTGYTKLHPTGSPAVPRSLCLQHQRHAASTCKLRRHCSPGGRRGYTPAVSCQSGGGTSVSAREQGVETPDAPPSESAAPPVLPQNGAPTSSVSDSWISHLLETWEPANSSPGTPELLQELHDECSTALQTSRMPNTRVESFRFTDVSSILKSRPQVPEVARGAASSMLSSHTLRGDDELRAVIMDGCLDDELSSLAGLPEGMFVGSIRDAPEEVVAMRLGAQASSKGTPFTQVNGAVAQDVVCIILPPGTEVDRPLHLLHIASGREECVSLNSPRLLVTLGRDARLQILEEFVPLDACSSCSYLTNATAEFELAESSHLQHGYANLEGSAAWHVKSTLVNQAARSHYTLTEASLGGRITRHDVVISQMGPETETIMRNLQVCGERQVHDLHSSLRLDHPSGTAKQLHKCIVASSTGRGVFDGNVQVNQRAQQTDAAQLSRNLLLAAKGAVFARPNLQIIADDVSCTHGCTVSDLEEDQLFYFLTRGIGAEQARNILVSSFGKEITQGFRYPHLQQRLEAAVNGLLSSCGALSL